MLRTEEIADRLAELQSTLQVLADRARTGDDLDMHFALGAAYRLAFGISRELVELDEGLRGRNTVDDADDADEYLGATSCPWPG